ncbi:MAG: FHA domain-containing protein, partial [Proteobacteria bacterium]|nr:FHA domain-containing protein [Pseudomonadota bacterium]
MRIKRRGRLLIVEDLDSRNGTFLNGDRIVNAVVRTGDKIHVGSTEIAVFSTEAEISLDPADLRRLGSNEGPEINIQPAKMSENEPELAAAARIPLQLDPAILQSNRVMQSIYEAQGDMLLSRTADDAGRTILKSLHKLLPWVQRSAVFHWHPESRKLTPLATRGEDAGTSVTLVQKALEDAINRTCGIYLAQRSDGASPGKTQTHQDISRFVLPMVSRDRITGVVHIEADPTRIDDAHRQIQPALALLERVAATLETFLLRLELDGWMIGVIDTLV